MKLVVVTQWVRAPRLKSHLTNASPAGQERTRVPPRKGPYEAGGSEDAGRVIEPRNGYSRGQRGYPSSGHRGESRRCASAGRQQSWTRHGKGAGHHRGLRAGHVTIGVTRELGRATCLLVPYPDGGTG